MDGDGDTHRLGDAHSGRDQHGSARTGHRCRPSRPDRQRRRRGARAEVEEREREGVADSERAEQHDETSGAGEPGRGDEGPRD